MIGGRAPKKQSAPQIDAPMRRGAEGAPCAQPHARPRGKELPAMRTVRDGVLLPRGKREGRGRPHLWEVHRRPYAVAAAPRRSRPLAPA